MQTAIVDMFYDMMHSICQFRCSFIGPLSSCSSAPRGVCRRSLITAFDFLRRKFSLEDASFFAQTQHGLRISCSMFRAFPWVRCDISLRWRVRFWKHVEVFWSMLSQLSCLWQMWKKVGGLHIRAPGAERLLFLKLDVLVPLLAPLRNWTPTLVTKRNFPRFTSPRTNKAEWLPSSITHRFD